MAVPNYKIFKKCQTLGIIVLAYFFSLHLEGNDPATWRMFLGLKSSNFFYQQEAAKFLAKQIRPFLHVCPLDISNDIEMLHQYLDKGIVHYCDFSGTYQFEAQFHIFHKHTGSYLVSFPNEYDPEKRQMYFLGEIIHGKVLIDSLICNLIAFFATFGVFCGFCKKQFSGKGTQHKCLHTETCFTCRKPFFKIGYYKNKNTLRYFCDSKVTPGIAQECPACNLKFFTENCMKHHKEKVCRWGYFCRKCEVYTYQSKFASKKKLKEEHKCGQKACYFCGEMISMPKQLHLCRMQLPTKDTVYTNMGFLDIQVSGASVANCEDCYFGDKTCDNCKGGTNNENKIIFCTFFCETNVKGNFDSYTFSLQKVMWCPQYYSQNYVPGSVNVPMQAPNGRKSFFQTYSKKKISEHTFTEMPSTMGHFFFFLLVKNIRNCTIIINDCDHNLLSLITKSLYQYGLKAQVIGSATIICVIVPTLGIRFVNVENYLDLAFNEQIRKSPFKPIFFPKKWRKEENFAYNGLPPNLPDIFDFDDTFDDLKMKKQFLEQITSPWDFQENLQKFSLFCLKVTTFHCLNFLKNALESQLLILNSTFSETFLPIHPFNPPLCTRAGYAYKLLCLFSPEMEKLCIVLPPIGMQSSVGELEYCSYVISQNPTKNFTFAWSQFGQINMKYCIPDLKIGNECHFWNGCLIHGHPKEKCLLQRKGTKRSRNMFGERLEDAFESYEAKKRRLKKNYSTITIKEMWQCEWQKKCKENENVRFFLENVYKRPPIYRLNARAAGKYINVV